MLSVNEMEKMLTSLDEKLHSYAHRPEIQMLIYSAMAQTQQALVATQEHVWSYRDQYGFSIDPPAKEKI